MYNVTMQSWEKVGSLKQAKTDVGVDNINKSTIIVIGGHTSAGSIFAAVL